MDILISESGIAKFATHVILLAIILNKGVNINNY
jgi:hypothetical protein